MSTTATSQRSNAGFWSSSKTFFLPVGSRIDPDAVAGYPIDMRVKADAPGWPRPRRAGEERAGALVVDITQWAIGCWERWLAGEGEEWRQGAIGAGRHLLEIQQPDGTWLHDRPLPHTVPLPAPWASGITQGQGASLFVRLHRDTGEAAFADGARLALQPLATPQSQGGLSGDVNGRPWPEEYPTEPQSHVLNGAIFALWGMRDVAVGLDDQAARDLFAAGIESLVANLPRYDTGSWSLYWLFPRPFRNRSSSFYHGLVINQLAATQLLAPHPELEQMRLRFQRYADSRLCRARAFAWKAAFRLLVPRNRFLAHRMPWTRSPAAGDAS